MSTSKSDFHKRAIEKVKLLWHLYILGENAQKLEAEFNMLPENLLMIGTGRHEMYKNRDGFLSGMSEDQLEVRDIQFELQDEWYEVQDISDTVCVVYGSIWASEKTLPGQTIFIDLEGSRFTVVCRETEHGVELCSVHHSMPYIDQGSGEYYPKSLSYLAKELEKRMELDHMTELYSRYYMEQHVTREMKHSDGYFFILDLDDFKHTNDTKGHLTGDQVIQEFAGILRHVSSPTAILGRMGGDEFAAWDTGIHSVEEAKERCSNLLTSCQTISSKLGSHVSCSAGIALCTRDTEDFSSLYRRTDQALYRAKALGKARICLADKN